MYMYRERDIDICIRVISQPYLYKHIAKEYQMSIYKLTMRGSLNRGQLYLSLIYVYLKRRSPYRNI